MREGGFKPPVSSSSRIYVDQQRFDSSPSLCSQLAYHTFGVAPVHGQVVAVAVQTPRRSPPLQRAHVRQQLPQLPHLRLQPPRVQLRCRAACSEMLQAKVRLYLQFVTLVPQFYRS